MQIHFFPLSHTSKTIDSPMSFWNSVASAAAAFDASEVTGTAETLVIESLEQSKCDVAPVGMADKVYSLLREAVRENGLGITRIAERTKAHFVALLPTERALLLVTTRTWPP